MAILLPIIAARLDLNLNLLVPGTTTVQLYLQVRAGTGILFRIAL